MRVKAETTTGGWQRELWRLSLLNPHDECNCRNTLHNEPRKVFDVTSDCDNHYQEMQPLPAPLKKSIALVLMGNFMEYFDLMLGVHLAIVLNKVFLPQDTGYEHILRPMTFLMPLCVQPIGALVWGYVGDNFGRKIVLITTMMFMSVCCIFLTFIPTYAQWGIMSTICFFTIRSIQSIMTSGENGSADVYVAEIVSAPKSYFLATILECSCSLGGLFACLVGSLSLLIDPVAGWKIAFIVGGTIAVLGGYARKDLKETPEFLNFAYTKRNKEKETNINQTYVFRNIFAEGLAHTYVGMFFYVQFAYLPSILEKQFGWSTSKILLNSTCLLLGSIVCEVAVGLLALKIDPRKTLKTLYALGIVSCLFFSTQSWLLSSPSSIIFTQSFFYIFAVGIVPVIPIFIKSYPLKHRLKSHMWGLVLAKMVALLLTAYVCEKFDSINILLLVMAGAAGVSLIGVYLFKAYDEGMTKEERQNYHLRNDMILTKAYSKWQKEHH
ncbi:MAG: MFS transporter [Alphaproteobacteria bacterium]|nr:MFS transporter [Alphaproteobacteria bacterium]